MAASAPPPPYGGGDYKSQPLPFQPPPYGSSDYQAGGTGWTPVNSQPVYGTPPPPPGSWVPPGHHFYAQPVTMQTHGRTTLVPNYMLDSESSGFFCPNCQATVWSKTDTEYGIVTWLWVLLLCLCICPLFWLPFFCSWCQDVHHRCPNCNYQLAELRRF